MLKSNYTWSQVVVFVACLAAPIAAYKLLDSVEAAAALVVIGQAVNFMIGRTAPPSAP